MPSPRFRRFSGWFAYCLCLFIPLLAGCGDFCLFCDGNGGGNGGGGQGRTAEAGDVILADQFANNISIYEYPSKTKRSLLTGFDDVSGLALYSSGAEDICDEPFAGLVAYQNGGNNLDEIDTFDQQLEQPDRLSLAVIPKGMTFPYGLDQTDPDETTIDLLFFTVNTQNRLYIYDLTGVNAPDELNNPHPITNNDVADFFESPTAIAVSADADEALIFVLNDDLNVLTGVNDSSIRRLRVDLTDWTPTSHQTIGTMEEPGWQLFDIAYYDQTNELFVSIKSAGQGGGLGRVLVIPNAADRMTSETLESNSTTAFIAQDYQITGLAVAPTDNEPGPASLLSIQTNQLGRVEQFDILQGGDPEEIFNFRFSFQFPEALAYDCTNERLLMTDVPFNSDSDRTFFQAVPTQ